MFRDGRSRSLLWPRGAGNHKLQRRVRGGEAAPLDVDQTGGFARTPHLSIFHSHRFAFHRDDPDCAGRGEMRFERRKFSQLGRRVGGVKDEIARFLRAARAAASVGARRPA